MYQQANEGIRGGISMVSNSHGISNNLYYFDEMMDKVVKLSKKKATKKGIYDSKKHMSFIMYLDANNLYGWAMSQKLPTGNHKWLSFMEISDLEEGVDDESDIGYRLVVDLNIPDHLHDLFNDYALAPEYYAPKLKELSPFQWA